MPRRILLSLLASALVPAAPAMAQDTTTAAGTPDASQPPIADAPVDEASPDVAPSPATTSPDTVTVRNVSPVELTAGTPIADSSGQAIGTVTKVAGNDIVVTDGSADYRVPITQIYAWRDGAADHFASRLPKSALTVEQAGG